MEAALQVDTAEDFGTDDQATASRWISELDLAEKAYQRWWKIGDRIDKIFADTGTTERERQFSLLWSNIETLGPAMVARVPTAVVNRRWKDADPVARTASEVIERAINFSLDAADFIDTLTNLRLEFLLVGRAQAWVRYVPHMQTVTAPKAPAPANDGGDPAESLDGEITDDTDQYDQVIWEEVVPDHVHWKDFFTNPARTWTEVRWVARRAFMTRNELIKRFGQEKGKACTLDWKTGTEGGTTEQDEQFHKAAVFEIWDKVSRKAIWICKGYTEAPLDERDDPLKLRDFFPCPRPLLGTCGLNTIVPTPDYEYYKKQAKQIDELTRRIGLLTEALKVRGYYAGSENQQLTNLLSAETNTLVPVESWAALMDKGGLDKLVSWFPIEIIANTLKAMIDLRKQAIDDVFQITGIADIMRGDTDPDETLGAQKLKATWGSSRIRQKQQEMARFAKDLLRIMGEVISGSFSVDTLSKMTGVQLFQSPEQKQQVQQGLQLQAQQAQIAAQHAQTNGQPAPPPPAPPDAKLIRMLNDPSWSDVEGLMRDNAMRSFHIDIETDSTIEPNDQEEKQRRVEFIEAVGQYLEKTLTVVQLSPPMLPVIVEGLKFLVRGFRVGREMEDVIEMALDKLQAQAEQQQAQGPQANPQHAAEQAKAQAAQMQGQAAQTNAQAAMIRANNDVFKAQADASLGAQQIQVESAHASADRQSAEAMHSQDMRADLQQSVIKAIERHFVKDVNSDKPMNVGTP